MTDAQQNITGAEAAARRMARSPERWAGMKAEAVAQGSSAQMVYAIRDAQHDIALLSAALSAKGAEIAAARAGENQWRNDCITFNAERDAATREAEAMREENARLRRVLEQYGDTYCEGWCSDGGAGHFEKDCGGCPARAVLAAGQKGKDT